MSKLQVFPDKINQSTFWEFQESLVISSGRKRLSINPLAIPIASLIPETAARSNCWLSKVTQMLFGSLTWNLTALWVSSSEICCSERVKVNRELSAGGFCPSLSLAASA